ncbi:MAG: delta-60 repeat domain-containing protein [Flavobacteriales bacterium]|nr:delta-60 repeat domain-containing protein [Flavobacteriales bacterium]
MNASPYFYSLTYGDYHVYADGAVLASGQHLLSDSTRGFVGFYDLIWFSNTGYLDTTKVHRQSNGIMWEFKELPDGKFICSCSCTQYEGQPVDKVFRVYPDGTLDTTFHTGINMGNIYAYHPLPDGRVLLGGSFPAPRTPTNCYSWLGFYPMVRWIPPSRTSTNSTSAYSTAHRRCNVSSRGRLTSISSWAFIAEWMAMSAGVFA